MLNFTVPALSRPLLTFLLITLGGVPELTHVGNCIDSSLLLIMPWF